MKVFTYHEPVIAGTERLLPLWKASWTAAGWQPVVLTQDDAEPHPLWHKFDDIVSGYPTVNHPHYERACWRRWLAFAWQARMEQGPVLCVDFDVIVNLWRPEELPAKRGRLVALTPVPTCAVVGDEGALDGWAMAAVMQAERGIVRVDGRMHVSDMTLAQALPGLWAWHLIGDEYRKDNFDFELRHASHQACERAGLTKEEAMALSPCNSR